MADRSIFSKEERNFWILDVLIKQVATPAVRKRFNIIVPPKDLASILNSNATILQNLCSKKVINAQQQIILLRVPGVTLPTMPALPTSGKKVASSEDFDLTLMICLLRNLNLVQGPVTGWDQLPPDNDNSLGANMTRIKIYRNKLSHPSKSRMKDHLFKKIWTSLKTALSDVSDGETDQMVHEIETFDFEGSNREQLLCKMQQNLHEIQNEMQFHRNLKENTTNVLEEWKSELEVFYETRGAAEVLKKIRTNNIVMIIGNSGAGKSTTMKYVSLQLEDEGYEIIPVSSANDIPFQRFSDRKQLFVIDNIFGKYRVDTIMFESWRRLNNRLKVIFKDKTAKFLCTLRRQVQNERSQFLYETIFDRTVVDLESSDLALSKTEKSGMLKNHLLLQSIEIEFDEVSMQKIFSCKYAFPLMCKLYSSNYDFFKREANYFTSPSEILRKEFDHLQRENYEVYCALVLIVIFDCEELKTIFDITCEINRWADYKLILQACGLDKSISRTHLYIRLLSLSGVFVGLDNPFKFIHDNIEETVAFHFGSAHPDVMLQCCKSAFLRERIRIKRHEMDDENVLIINCSSYAALSQRLLREIKNGKFHDILLSEPLQNEDFVNHFVSHIEKEQTSINDLESIHCTEMLLPSYPQVGKKFRDTTDITREALMEDLQSSNRQFIYWIVATGCHLLFQHIFERQKGAARQLFERYNLIHDLLHLAVLGGNSYIIKSLIEKGASVNSCDKYGIPLLCKIAGTKRCDIAKLLIEAGGKINQRDQVLGWTACHVASWFNDVEMLQLLLSRGGDVEMPDYKTRVPLVVAVQRNNEQAVSVLLSYHACAPDNISIFGMSSCNLLEEALLNKNSEIISMLSNCGGVVNSNVVSFPFSFPKNSVAKGMLELFLKTIRAEKSRNMIKRKYVNLCDAIYKSDTVGVVLALDNSSARMNMYSFFRDIQVRDQTNPLPNFDQNYLQFTPLHVAAVCDNCKAAKVLMDFGGNPFQRDVHGRTALHLAESRVMLEILLRTASTTAVTNLSSQSVLLKVLTCIFTFKFVHKIFNIFMNVNIQKNVNARDKAGNTPLHSIVIRTSNLRKCVGALETLREYGADASIRCNKGYLPLDLFRSVSPLLEECDIERGERVLGCNKTKRYIKNEKWYFTSWSIFFMICYLWFCSFVAKSACNAANDSEESGIFQFRYMFYSQLLFVIILHRACRPCSMVMQLVVHGMGTALKRSNIYSEIVFFQFSECVAIVMVVIRTIFYDMSSVAGQTIFNLYCACLCFFLLVIHFPFRIFRFYRKYQSLMLLIFKVILVCFPLWIILPFFVSPSIESNDTCNLVQKHWNYYDLILFSIMKLLSFYFYLGLFIIQMIVPLLYNLYQPVHWYTTAYRMIVYKLYILFFIIEILTVPVAMFICNTNNC